MRLQTKLFLIISVTTLFSLVGMGAILLNGLLSFWKEDIKQQVNNHESYWFERIDLARFEAKSMFQLIENSPLIERYYIDENISLYSSANRIVKNLLDSAQLVDEIRIINIKGEEEFRQSRGIINKKDWIDPALLGEINHDPGVITWKIYTHEDFSDLALVAFKPLYHINTKTPSKARDKLVAIAATTFAIPNLLKPLRDTNWNSSIILASNYGEHLFYNRESLTNEISLTESFFAETQFPLITPSNLHGVSAKRIDESHWLVTQLNISQWQSEVNRIYTEGTLLVLLFFSIISLVIFFILRATILQPLKDLIKATKSNNKLEDQGLASSSEFNELFQSFSQMKSRIQQQTSSLMRMAYIDDLTQLPNRTAMFRTTQSAIEQAEHNDDTLAMMFLDLDGFKQINDVMGHGIGDKLLKQVADRLKNLLDIEFNFDGIETDGVYNQNILCRVGGDEFTLLLYDLTKQPSPPEVAEKIIEAFTHEFRIHTKDVYIGVSIGIAEYPTHCDDLNDLMKFADTAMYYAKNHGKMRYAEYDTEMSSEEEQKLELETAIMHSLDAGEIQGWLQPKIDPNTRVVKGFEILARIDSKRYGFLPPNKFIPIAEENGLINYITLVLIKQACLNILAFKEEFQKEYSIAVNLSPSQLGNSKLLQDIQDIIDIHRIPHHLFEFEITEHTLMEDEALGQQMLEQLRENGYKTALDDFGVGYSSLGHLRRLPFDTLKIDRSFFKDITNDDVAKSILTSILDLASRLDMEVVAEGIETIEQLDFVASKSVDLVQGYIYTRPLNQVEIQAFLIGFDE